MATPDHDQTCFAECILRSIPPCQADAIRVRFAGLGITLIARCAQCERVLDRADGSLSD